MRVCTRSNLYYSDLMLHLQGQVLQYVALQYLHLGVILGNMQVAYSSYVTDV